MTEDELARMDELARKATPGPWRNDRWPDMVRMATGVALCHLGSTDDAAFIVAARAAVPALLAEVRRLREALRACFPPDPRFLDVTRAVPLCRYCLAEMPDGVAGGAHGEGCPWALAREALTE